MSDAPAAPTTGSLAESDAVLLSALLDGELAGAERAALEERLARDPVLREELESLRASREVLRAAAQSEARAVPSAGFASFGSSLSQAVSAELPVAPARKVPRARRVALVLAAVFLGLWALSLAGRVARRWGGPPASSWRLKGERAEVSVLREGRVVTVRSGDVFWLGDKLALDPGVTASLVGPQGLKTVAAGSAVLVFDQGGGLFLEEGLLTVEGPDAAAAKALKLRTKDGEVAANETSGGFCFEVEAGK